MAADVMYVDPGAPVQPHQLRGEFAALLRVVRDLKPATILEIGVMAGGTLYQWMKACPGATIVAIDLPDGPFGIRGSARPSVWMEWSHSYGVDLHLLMGDSRNGTNVATAHVYAPYDFAFIDGDHTYEAVRSDWETYAPMVRKGGLIAFHDILPHSNAVGVEVNRLWREIQQEHETVELACADGQAWGGIGLVWRS